MGSSKKGISDSSGGGFERGLFGEGLERCYSSGQIASEIRDKKSASLVGHLCEYAGAFPSSRETIIGAFDLYLKEVTCADLARAVRQGLSEIVATNMVEALGAE